MSAENKPIGVIGVGWVGLVTASCFAELGVPVIAMDVDAAKVESLAAGDVPIHEPGLAELVTRNAERLTFTTSMDEVLAAARLLFCCVDTPPTYSGDADLSRVRAVVDQLPADGEHALVMKSTVPAGTGAAIRREHPGLAYVSCPEFLKEGSAVADFMNPDRVVIGADPGDERSADAVAALYSPLGGERVMTDVASAEMIKLASNAFLATKISFVNEIANVCEETGADVTEVARGMGLDERIGPSFLRAGIGYGGSCFAADETLLVRLDGTARLLSFEELWSALGRDAVDGEAVAPSDLKVWSWVPGEGEPEWMSVSALTRRDYDGDLIEVGTKMGRKIRVTPDHPFVVGDGRDDEVLTHVLAEELTADDWLPLATGTAPGFEPELLPLSEVFERGFVDHEDVLVRAGAETVARIAERPPADCAEIFATHPNPIARRGDVKKSGTLRLPEYRRAGVAAPAPAIGTAGNGTFSPFELIADAEFWRVVGLYLAEGCMTVDAGGGGTRRQRLIWSFHPTREEHLVSAVVAYWARNGVKTAVRTTATSRRVEISSRIIASWWTEVLGLGRDCYSQRLPDYAWEQSVDRKKALLSGLWEGDGSWSLVNGGPSVILEWGSVSARLADGVARLLADVGIVCSWRRGRTAKSTVETHWLRVSGADQVEQALFLVPESQRTMVADCMRRQAKRIRPTGYRRFGSRSLPWVRVTKVKRTTHRGSVYSLKVPGSHTVATTGSLILGQCFPKDVSALKQLAGNTGYHFQLLNSVIEVNELQKRRVVQKLEKHLGSLVGRRVALLGLAFKPDTDDMREASSLVLSARLQGEGATVVAYDPVAENAATDMLPSVEMAASAEDALAGADAAILVTEWQEFAALPWEEIAARMANPLLVDGRNFLDPDTIRAAGFVYEGIGRPTRTAEPT